MRKPTAYGWPSGIEYTDLNFTYDAMGHVTQALGSDGVWGVYLYKAESDTLAGGWDSGTYGTAVGSETVDNWVFEYDGDGRLTKELLETQGGGNRYALGRRTVQYDAAGRRSKQRFFSANRPGHLNLDTTQTYTYDSGKYRLKGVQRDGSATEKATYSYDNSSGRLMGVTYGNGASTSYTYWGSGALHTISHRSAGGTTIGSVNYNYDRAGNVIAAILDDGLQYSGDAVVVYEYDDLHRLTREACVPGPGSYRAAYDYRYEYDAVGNRTAKYEYISGELRWEYYYEYSLRNELVHEDAYYDGGGGDDYCWRWEFTYDLRGNLTKKELTGFEINEESQEFDDWYWEYEWDSRDLLTRVFFHDDFNQVGEWTVEYKYDLLGRRVARRLDAGPWKWYFYDGLKVIAEGSAGRIAGFHTRWRRGRLVGSSVAAMGQQHIHITRIDWAT